MAIYIKTLSFSTRGAFKPERDDSRVNDALQQLQSQGAKISDVRVAFGESLVIYLIIYEATSPII
ncbi:MAG TPA: hypothetical protein VMX96_02140 [Dehalococcoidia bacterium]|nr:hypothetical protein [Dehalococcoidia bacterium]